MSKLDDLIRELCPDGVEYKKLGEIATVLRGASPRPIKKYITNSTDGVNWIKIGDVSAGSKYITQTKEKVTKDGAEKSRRVHKGDFILSNSMSFGRPYILTIEGCVHDGWLVISDFQSVFTSDFLYYLLSSSSVQQEMKKRASFGGAVQNLNADIVKDLSLPMLPFEIQREIVRMLDIYTESVVELQKQLKAELTARKTQYAYYRDSLLAMESQWNHVKIIDMLSQPITDGPHTTPQFVQNGVPFISVDSIWDGKIHFEKMRGYITEAFDEECCKKYKPQKNDVYMVKSGSTTGKVAFVDTDIRFNIWSPLAAMRVNEQNSARFLFYLLQTEKVQKQVKAKASHGSQPNLGMRELEQFEVDVPPLDVQNRIVNVLDNFEKICSDLNIGLPAEIEARQKQYEYYRDKLLTFAENGNTILSRAEQSRAEQSRAEQSRAEQSRAEQSRAEQSRALIKLLQYVFGYAMLPLSEIANVFRGEYITKKNEKAGNIPVILGGQEPAYYIDRANHTGEIVAVARSGASAGFVSYWNEPIFITDGFGYEAKKEVVAPRYLYYVLKNKEAELNGMKRGAGVPHVSGERLGEINLPVPPIEEQKRVVSILDRFDAICNDLTSGLPAETEARQRQYEHYRDKLLNFKELN